MADFYNVTTDYLLARTETRMHSNDSTSSLHLSDQVIDLLKSDQIDIALFCELAVHKDFVKLLADIQIYIEGIATQQIHNLNAWVNVARNEIIEKYQPSEHDKTTYLLQASHIQEGEYFSKRIHDDIDSIIEDIRQSHIGRRDSAPKESAIDELKRDLEEIANFEGSRAEQLLLLFCKQTKLKYSKLSEEEKQWLTRIVQKSELAKGFTSQRGK